MAVWLKLLTDGVLRQEIASLLIGIGGIALSQSLRFTLSLVGNDMRLVLSERVGFAFDQEFARLVANVPGIEHLERADYLDRIELLRQSQSALGGSLNSLLNIANAVVAAIGTLIVLAYLDPRLLCLVVFAIPTIPVARIQQQWLKEGEDRSATPSRMARHLRGLTTDRDAGMELRVFGLQHEIRERYRSAAIEARRPLLRSERRIAWANTGRQVLLVIGYVMAIAFMLRRAANGQASAGDVLAAIYISRQVGEAVVSPIFSVARLGKVLRAAGRLLWLRDHAEKVAEQRTGNALPPERLREGITFDNVSFTYPGTDRPVLQNISVKIPAGTVVALVGENGAGKTTMVKLLSRMYEPTEGRILVDGVDLAKIDVEKWRKRLSAAFQDFSKPEITAQRAVGIGDLARLDDEAAALCGLDRASAGEVLDALPDGLQTQLGPRWRHGVDLSTGQWQKLAIGRALMRDEPLVAFLDEPTASLDALTEYTLFERFSEAARSASESGSITILVSHRFSTVRSADLVLVLDEGQAADVGSHEELMEHPGVYAELYSLQAESYR